MANIYIVITPEDTYGDTISFEAKDFLSSLVEEADYIWDTEMLDSLNSEETREFFYKKAKDYYISTRGKEKEEENGRGS